MRKRLDSRLSEAAALLKTFGAREVYVFGSASTGKARPGADLDLAVTGLPPEVFFQALAQVSAIARCDVDLLDLDEGGPFAQYLRAKGKLRRVA